MSRYAVRVRQGDLAAYFFNKESQNHDWRCDASFICLRCGGHTSVHREEPPSGCLLCDQNQPEVPHELLIELGMLRERVQHLEGRIHKLLFRKVEGEEDV